jgi:O-antigen biosynthesis protein
MGGDHTERLTSGYLPIAAFEHSEPTSVGLVDLDRSISPSAPDGRPWDSAQRDALLLVRLHGEPLTVVHIGHALQRVGDHELATAIWQSAGAEIHRHIERYRCASVPTGSSDLVDGLDSKQTCPGARATKLDASLAVIICTAGRPEQLARCIRSLLAQRRAELEVVVVDNRPHEAQTVRTVEAIAAEDARVRYVAEPRVGLSVSRNRGVRETNADLVAFTDDDVVADDGWLEWLVTPFAEPAVTVACGMVLPLELETEAQKRFEQYAGFSKGMQRRTYDLRSGPAPGRLLFPFVNGAIGVGNNMAFRRAEIVATGGFDTALGAGSPAGACEETWAFSKALLRGGRIVYEPRALCWHEHRRDGDALRDQIFGYGAGLGALLTKALATDPRFYVTATRSLGIALGMQWRKRTSTCVSEPGVEGGRIAPTEELLRARREGVLRGPLRYATGLLRARREGLGGVIRRE